MAAMGDERGKAGRGKAGRGKAGRGKSGQAKAGPGARGRRAPGSTGPAGEAAPERPPNRTPWRRWARRLALALVLVAATPFALAALYAVPGIRPASTLMLADHLAGRSVAREWRPLADFPPALVASVLASEDARYCAHRGVDWGAVATVAREAMRGERPRGASTITMQTVKNLFLPASRSVLRKAAEVPLALWADLVWGKRRTLEIYLNVAEWAPGHYGAASGARAWFGRDAASLTRAQAAALAVTLPNPALRNPADPGPRTAALARLNEARAREMGPYLSCLD